QLEVAINGNASHQFVRLAANKNWMNRKKTNNIRVLTLMLFVPLYSFLKSVVCFIQLASFDLGCFHLFEPFTQVVYLAHRQNTNAYPPKHAGGFQ
ncbi:MAG: hypothetical protein AAGL17_24880, partial [Cyanobacteria bacterium J06576_12]